MKAKHRPKPNALMRNQARETAALARIAEDISSCFFCEDILGRVYKSFRGLLPYDRIGLALVTDEGRAVRSADVRSSARKLLLPPGYRASLKGSSLAGILKTGKARILNDLEDYLKGHPRSDSTRRIVSEGMRSSLTYPLVAQGKRIGFIFFSSGKRGAYTKAHIASFRRVATLLSLAVEKGRLHEELGEADEMKNRLMGIAAHDLRNPITVVLGYLSLLQDAVTGKACREPLAVIRRKCIQMLAIVDGMLDSSIVQSRGLELGLKRLDLRDFLRQVFSDSQFLAKAKSIRLKLVLPPELPKVMADRPRLLQTFDNLIDNAVKYSMPKTVVTLSARTAPGAVEILVADQGPGIPSRELPSLFKEFGRACIRPTSGERSIGLGIFIAHRFVKAHGGTIRVESRPGDGTTFIVALPLRALRDGRALFDLRR